MSRFLMESARNSSPLSVPSQSGGASLRDLKGDAQAKFAQLTSMAEQIEFPRIWIEKNRYLAFDKLCRDFIAGHKEKASPEKLKQFFDKLKDLDQLDNQKRRYLESPGFLARTGVLTEIKKRQQQLVEELSELAGKGPYIASVPNNKIHKALQALAIGVSAATVIAIGTAFAIDPQAASKFFTQDVNVGVNIPVYAIVLVAALIIAAVFACALSQTASAAPTQDSSPSNLPIPS